MTKYHFYLSGPMTGREDYNFPAFHKAARILRSRGFKVFNPAESFNGDTNLEWTTYMEHDYEAISQCEAVLVMEGWKDSLGCIMEVLVAISSGKKIWQINNDGTYNLYRLFINKKTAREQVEDIMTEYVLSSQAIEPKTEPSAYEDVVENLVEYMTNEEYDEIVPELLDINEFVIPKKYNSILEEADELVSNDRGNAYGHPLDDFTKSALIATAVLYNKLKPGEMVVAEDIPLIMQGIKISRETNKHKRDNLVDGAGYWKTLDMVIEERKNRENFKRVFFGVMNDGEEDRID